MSPAESRSVIRLALFLPGERELERAGVSGEWIENPRDGSFADAFSFGTVEPPIVEKIDAAPGALLVQLTDDLREGRERVVAVVEKLRKHGALAVRLEQSKLGWAIDRWLEFVRPGDPWAAVGRTFQARYCRCGVRLIADRTAQPAAPRRARTAGCLRVDVVRDIRIDRTPATAS